ncbi:relaxase domain-containing protein [Streptomyces rubiginosohelvolus]|uniref:relaxase domain-containing protein n=1 Tax=Streptomyces rubiginosohelvolus TaxID=67362 RepID=UPI003807495A
MFSGAYRCRTGRSARDRRRRGPARTPLRAARERGGVPAGRWTGRGLATLGLATGEDVTEAQLRNLFGERGRHPDAKGRTSPPSTASTLLPPSEGACRRPYQPRRAAPKARTERPRRRPSFS